MAQIQFNPQIQARLDQRNQDALVQKYRDEIEAIANSREPSFVKRSMFNTIYTKAVKDYRYPISKLTSLSVLIQDKQLVI